MTSGETQYKVVAALLQAGAPLRAEDLADQCGLTTVDVLPVLAALVEAGKVVPVFALQDPDTPLYRWSAIVTEGIKRSSSHSKRHLLERMAPADPSAAKPPSINGKAARLFNQYLAEEYRPPDGKRMVVFAQDASGRPFSSTPLHRCLRAAIATATGCDPVTDFLRCPVHVVVVAGGLGPVPYDLEGLFPANVPSQSLKQLPDEQYRKVRSSLTRRMAAYLASHSGSYDRLVAFAEGRCADMIVSAAQSQSPPLPLKLLPRPDGPRVARVGTSVPQGQWEVYWIQLYLEIVDWLGPAVAAEASARLKQRLVDVDWPAANQPKQARLAQREPTKPVTWDRRD